MEFLSLNGRAYQHSRSDQTRTAPSWVRVVSKLISNLSAHWHERRVVEPAQGRPCCRSRQFERMLRQEENEVLAGL